MRSLIDSILVKLKQATRTLLSTITLLLPSRMSVAVYSAFFAVLSFYRLLIETYQQEITMAVGASISVAILFTFYLYTQARRKAEQVFTGAANTLEERITALSGDTQAQKQSLEVELHNMKEDLLKKQKDSVDSQRWELSSLKAEIATQKGELATLKAEMSAQRRVVDELCIWRSDFCETQKGYKGELAALKAEMVAQNTTLKGDISKILVWLGMSPYLPNPATESLRSGIQLGPRRGFMSRPQQNHQQRDMSEAAMRKQFETAGL